METETTIADAKGQLSALAEVQEAAILEAHPEPQWWMPFVAGLVGPFAVAVEVVDGYMEFVLIAALLGVLGIAAAVELKKTRVRRSALSLPRNVKVSKFVFLMALAGGVAAVGSLAEVMNTVLLGLLAYATCVAMFWIWGMYMSRVIAQCSRRAAVS